MVMTLELEVTPQIETAAQRLGMSLEDYIIYAAQERAETDSRPLPPNSLESMTKEELDAMLEARYQEVLDGKILPAEQVFSELMAEL